jgi:hypothetical protein
MIDEIFTQPKESFDPSNEMTLVCLAKFLISASATLIGENKRYNVLCLSLSGLGSVQETSESFT